MPRRASLAHARRAVVGACALTLLAAAPASAADRLGADLGVSAGPSGVKVEGDVAGAQVGVDVTAPSSPVPAPPPGVRDPGGVVGGATGTVNGVVDGATGDLRSEPAASPASGAGSGGGESAGAGGGGSSPSGRSSRGTGSGGERGGDARRGSRARPDRDDPVRGARRDGNVSTVGAGGDPGQSASTAAAPASAVTGDSSGDDSSGITRTLERVVEVITLPMWIALAVLALLAAGFFARSVVVARRARRLAEQREELLQDVGLLQQALLPEIPERLGDLASSVAYRPADGPAAGGDFYDAFLLDGERVAIIVGDVSGHGRAALARTALMRYTLRAYLDAGLEPRRALSVAGQALDDDLGGDFATVVLAVHDPARATLTYASAGHPPPIIAGSGPFDPVTALSSPPIGAGLPTGRRQTTLHLPGDAIACFFTDGLIEARRDGGLVGRERLCRMLDDLGPTADARGVIDAVADYADETPDDMAACVVRPDAAGAADHVPDRVEEVELNAVDLSGDRVARFLAACGVDSEAATAALGSVEAGVREFGGVLLRVRVDTTGARCEVESAAGLHDPLGAPPLPDDAPARV